MAEIQPFTGIRYADAASLSGVTCPPYDVLSPDERQALWNRSPHQTARLILPEGDGDVKYQNAAALWTDWLRSGVLQPDATPGLYVTATEFAEPGAPDLRRRRLGLVCLLKLHEYSDRVVLPHERTLDRPKADRLALLQATQAHFESILTLIDDPDKAFYEALVAATQLPPLAAFDGDDDQRHTLWKVENAENLASLAAYIAPLPVFIADGHHRYETALAHARASGTLGTNAPSAFLLATITSFADPGLVLLPTHRLVRGTPEDARNTLFRHLEEFFDVQEVDRDDLEARLRIAIENQSVFGLVVPSGRVYQVSARDDSLLDAALPRDLDPSLRALDVTILQHLVLDRALGIPVSEIATTDRLAYTRDVHDAIHGVRNETFEYALLLGRPPVESVRNVSLAGQVMPQKSTFFFPKLVSGLVMYDLDAAANTEPTP